MGEQQSVEVEVQQSPIGLPQPALGLTRVVHQAVRDEGQPLDSRPADDAVRDRQRAVAGNVQGGLVRGDRTDLVGNDLTGKLIAEGEAGDGTTAPQLVGTPVYAVDLTPEGVAQQPRVAIVMAIGEQGCARARRPAR